MAKYQCKLVLKKKTFVADSALEAEDELMDNFSDYVTAKCKLVKR
jgi:hypothetical protein